MENQDIPPIASPLGGDNSCTTPHPNADCARVAIALRFASVCRYVLFEWLTPMLFVLLLGAPLVGTIIALPLSFRFYGWAALPIVFTAILSFLVAFALPPTFLTRLCSRRRFEIWMSGDGLWKRYPHRDIFFRWRKFVWIVERGGNVWLATFSDGCFIPREAFSSRDEAREFVQIARELKQSKGADWRHEWSGRVFGAQSSDDERERSIPR